MRKKHVVAAIMGTAIEYYDYMLYMHLLIIITPLYLPNSNPEINALLGFSTFAIGFFAQPIGGIVFGHVGDKYGRRKAMGIAIIFSALGSCCIGLLPTYAQIGFLAPLLLIFFRCLQCFSVGGEVPGAACFLMENSTDKNRCLRSSYINVAWMFSGILAASLGFICTQSFMPEWGWRIPFLIVILFGYIGIYIRRSLIESKAFTKVVEEQEILKAPLLEVIKRDKLQIVCSIGIAAGVLAPLTMLYSYLPYVITTKLKISVSYMLLMNAFVMFCSAFMLLAMGILADKLGAKKVMSISGIAFIVTAFPLFSIINTTQNTLVIVFIELIISLMIAGITAPLNVVMTFMFPTKRRYTGCAFAWGVGSIVFGGLSPLISHAITTITHNQNGPAFWLMLCVGLMLLALKHAPVLRNLSSSSYVGYNDRNRKSFVTEDLSNV